MTPKIATVIGGLRIALQALGAKMGVTLRIEGDQAYTNGSEIIIPTLPPDDHKAAVTGRVALELLRSANGEEVAWY